MPERDDVLTHPLPVPLAPWNEIRAAREWLEERLDDGASCPCCGQHGQIYRRKITSSMARALVELYRYGSPSTGAFVHWPTVLKNAGLPRGGDEAKLAHWRLVQEEARVRDDGGRAGYWRLASPGYAFLRREVSVPKYVLLYDGRFVGSDGPGVTIDDALGTKFRLDELLRGE